MTTTSRNTLRGALWAMAITYAFLFSIGGWIGWSLFIDTELPLRNLQGRLVSWDAETRTAVVEWVGTRQRFCEGTSTRQLRDGVILDLEGATITMNGTPDDQRWQKQYPGAADYEVTWRSIVGVPDIVKGVARYVVTFRYACNTFQRLLPLVVTPEPVEIMVGDPYELGSSEFG